MAWTGNPLNVDVGPGKLWAGSIDATEPTSAEGPITESQDGGADGEFVPIGFTDEGSSFTYEVSSEGITVAEVLAEIASKRTGTVSQVSFAMAEMTARNLNLALNGGIVAPSSVEPVDVEDEKRIKLVWQADNGALWVFRRCYNIGTIEIANRKAPQKRLIAVQFKVELPAVGKEWVAFPNADGLV